MTATVAVRPLGHALGAGIEGIDIASPLDHAAIAANRAALLDRVIVRLPGQGAGPGDLKALARRFGELDDNRRFLHPVVRTLLGPRVGRFFE